MDGVKVLSLLTLATNVVFALSVVIFLLSHFFPGVKVYWKKIEKYLSKNAYKFALLVSITATLGSLYLSEIRGFEPCKLCWLQRIFMYPLPILLAVSIKKNLKDIWNYVIPLTIIGGLIAIYHYYFQISGNAFIPCSAVGFSVSCSQRFFTYWGYITIPWMSLSAFVLILSLMLLARRESAK